MGDEVDAVAVLGHQAEEQEASYSKRDLLVYATGIGCKNTAEELKFLYEDHEAFGAFPTYPIVLPFKGCAHDVVPFPSPTLFSFPPGLPVTNPAMVLHAEQALLILSPLPTDGGVVKMKSRVLGLYDKGKGALLREETHFRDENTGSLLAVGTSGSFIRGVSGFQSRGPPLPPRVTRPSRPADATVEESTTAEQALVYRLSGDYNALHADPDIAQAVGFDRPILHGLCTYGHAARALFLKYGNNDAAFLRNISARFSKPAYPGETLVTCIWKVDEHHFQFQTKAKERDAIVLDDGLAQIGGPPMTQQGLLRSNL